MLQQTQAERVAPKYIAFLKKFPSLGSLARAGEREVLSLWSGLGYNRRALYLCRTAKIILEQHKGVVPGDPDILETFPGLGKYTSRAVVTFSYDLPCIFIETNIRSVFIETFFKKTKRQITDKEILPLIEKTLPKIKLQQWYYALMDYGAYLKKVKKVSNVRHAIYKKQKPFKGSLREVRGSIIRYLLTEKRGVKLSSIFSKIPFEKERIVEAVKLLVKEKLVKETRGMYRI